MPKQTFYKLPKEKQERILAAAKREFTKVRFSDASINRMIRDAGIPRGSFYQYFEDKTDIFLFFLEDYKKEILGGFTVCIRAHGGELLSAIVDFLDDFIEEAFKNPREGIRVIVSEPWIFENIWADMLGGESSKEVSRVKQEGRSAVDWSKLDLLDEAEEEVFIHIFGAVIRDSLCEVFHRNEMSLEEAKNLFHERIESLRRHYEKRP